MKATIYLNGKFTAQATTGVQRAARCMVSALDRVIARAPAAAPLRWVLLCPPGSETPTLRSIEVATVGSVAGGLHGWEQVCLPWAARSGLLVSLAGSAPAWAARQICTFHDAAVFDRPDFYTWRFGAWYRWMFKRLGASAVAIVTVSEFSKSRLVATLGIAGDRIVVIANGGDHLESVEPDVDFLSRAGLVGKRFLLAVGSDSANKNLGAVRQAFAQMPASEGLELVIAGGGRGAVFAAGGAGSEDTAADQRVLRVGQVGDGPLKALYGSALALVFPSLYEGFGLPPLEAMSCGCPVAASNTSALPEVCGGAALPVDPGSVADIGRAMARLVEDAGLRDLLAARGRERVRLFTWDAAAVRLCSLLQRHAAAEPEPVAAARITP